ncbi:hypothetical protein RI129_012526 [Pyrocoelia pectoralis]|uniref:C2H2-type domain-containing protein n=1 Tax=Pyrocoelia pectoralis TaxID=417401 RepID=A0AAN7V2Z3_9COLE
MDLSTFTCRTCLTMYDINEMVANPSNLKLQIETCIPELTLGIINDYVVCRECIQSLISAYKFKKMCLETEEKIYNYMLCSSCKSKSVDINSVVQWDALKNSPIESIDLVDSSSEASETINLDTDDDSLEEHDMNDDFKEFVEKEATPANNYQKLCEIENQFAAYSIDEFYSKGVVKLPECSVVLDHLSQDLIRKYCVNTSVNTINKKTRVTFKSKTSKVNHVKTKFHRKKSNNVTSSRASLRLQSDRYQCTKCSYFTMYEESLFYHLKRHNQKCTKLRTADCATLKCVECNYETHSDQYLISHYITEHFDRPPFLCKLCKSSFNLPILLINHLIGHSEKCAEIETEHNYAIT